MAKTLRDLLTDERIHVMDGAMGTVLYGRGVFVSVCYDELNFSQPDLVRGVHRSYVEAGAEIIETNTFGANPVKLSSHGLDERTEELNRTAVEIAREAAGDSACVVGAIGPLGIRIEPWGPTGKDEAQAFFHRQVRGLVEGQVDGFILETFSDVNELQCAIAAVRTACELPIIAQITLEADGKTSYGTSIEAAALALANEQIQVIGLNCSVGPATMLDAVERLADVTSLPISAQPNAGLPRAVGDRQIYLASPEYMAQYARRMIEAGARFVGGCCGTTPDHIERISGFVASTQPRISSTSLGVAVAKPGRGVAPVPMADRSEWGRRLTEEGPIIAVEVTPPSGWDSAPLIEHCRALKDANVHAVHIRTASRGHTMGPLAAAMIVERDVGIETIAHYTCRDRNMLGMLRDLMGAAAVGTRNIVLDTGAPAGTDLLPKSKAVFDIDSIGLTNVVNGLNRGMYPGGDELGAPTEFVVGVTVKQAAADLDRECQRFNWKAQAGAEFTITDPVFDVETLMRFLTKVDQPDVRFIAGIRPLQSLREAEYLANEVPWIYVPTTIVERMRTAQQHGADNAKEEGLRIAAEICSELLPRVHGIHVSTANGELDPILALLSDLSVTQAR